MRLWGWGVDNFIPWWLFLFTLVVGTAVAGILVEILEEPHKEIEMLPSDVLVDGKSCGAIDCLIQVVRPCGRCGRINGREPHRVWLVRFRGTGEEPCGHVGVKAQTGLEAIEKVEAAMPFVDVIDAEALYIVKEKK